MNVNLGEMSPDNTSNDKYIRKKILANRDLSVDSIPSKKTTSITKKIDEKYRLNNEPLTTYIPVGKRISFGIDLMDLSNQEYLQTADEKEEKDSINQYNNRYRQIQIKEVDLHKRKFSQNNTTDNKANETNSSFTVETTPKEYLPTSYTKFAKELDEMQPKGKTENNNEDDFQQNRFQTEKILDQLSPEFPQDDPSMNNNSLYKTSSQNLKLDMPLDRAFSNSQPKIKLYQTVNPNQKEKLQKSHSNIFNKIIDMKAKGYFKELPENSNRSRSNVPFKRLKEKLEDDFSHFIQKHRFSAILMGNKKYEGKTGDFYLKNKNTKDNTNEDLKESDSLGTINSISSERVNGLNENNQILNNDNKVVIDPIRNQVQVSNEEPLMIKKIQQTKQRSSGKNNKVSNISQLQRYNKFNKNEKSPKIKLEATPSKIILTKQKFSKNNIMPKHNKSRSIQNTEQFTTQNTKDIKTHQFDTKVTTDTKNPYKSIEKIVLLNNKNVVDLTPIPKRRNQVTKHMKQEYTDAERAAVTIRRIEYSVNFSKKKEDITKEAQDIYLHLLIEAKAIIIQRWWRKMLSKLINMEMNSIIIQKAFRGFLSRSAFKTVIRQINYVFPFLTYIFYIIERRIIKNYFSNLFLNFAHLAQTNDLIKRINLIKGTFLNYLRRKNKKIDIIKRGVYILSREYIKFAFNKIKEYHKSLSQIIKLQGWARGISFRNNEENLLKQGRTTHPFLYYFLIYKSRNRNLDQEELIRRDLIYYFKKKKFIFFIKSFTYLLMKDNIQNLCDVSHKCLKSGCYKKHFADFKRRMHKYHFYLLKIKMITATMTKLMPSFNRSFLRKGLITWKKFQWRSKNYCRLGIMLFGKAIKFFVWNVLMKKFRCVIKNSENRNKIKNLLIMREKIKSVILLTKWRKCTKLFIHREYKILKLIKKKENRMIQKGMKKLIALIYYKRKHFLVPYRLFQGVNILKNLFYKSFSKEYSKNKLNSPLNNIKRLFRQRNQMTKLQKVLKITYIYSESKEKAYFLQWNHRTKHLKEKSIKKHKLLKKIVKLLTKRNRDNLKLMLMKYSTVIFKSKSIYYSKFIEIKNGIDKLQKLSNLKQKAYFDFLYRKISKKKVLQLLCRCLNNLSSRDIKYDKLHALYKLHTFAFLKSNRSLNSNFQKIQLIALKYIFNKRYLRKMDKYFNIWKLILKIKKIFLNPEKSKQVILKCLISNKNQNENYMKQLILSKWNSQVKKQIVYESSKTLGNYSKILLTKIMQKKIKKFLFDKYRRKVYIRIIHQVAKFNNKSKKFNERISRFTRIFYKKFVNSFIIKYKRLLYSKIFSIMRGKNIYTFLKHYLSKWKNNIKKRLINYEINTDLDVAKMKRILRRYIKIKEINKRCLITNCFVKWKTTSAYLKNKHTKINKTLTSLIKLKERKNDNILDTYFHFWRARAKKTTLLISAKIIGIYSQYIFSKIKTQKMKHNLLKKYGIKKFCEGFKKLSNIIVRRDKLYTLFYSKFILKFFKTFLSKLYSNRKKKILTQAILRMQNFNTNFMKRNFLITWGNLTRKVILADKLEKEKLEKKNKFKLKSRGKQFKVMTNEDDILLSRLVFKLKDYNKNKIKNYFEIWKENTQSSNHLMKSSNPNKFTKQEGTKFIFIKYLNKRIKTLQFFLRKWDVKLKRAKVIQSSIVLGRYGRYLLIKLAKKKFRVLCKNYIQEFLRKPLHQFSIVIKRRKQLREIFYSKIIKKLYSHFFFKMRNHMKLNNLENLITKNKMRNHLIYFKKWQLFYKQVNQMKRNLRRLHLLKGLINNKTKDNNKIKQTGFINFKKATDMLYQNSYSRTTQLIFKHRKKDRIGDKKLIILKHFCLKKVFLPKNELKLYFTIWRKINQMFKIQQSAIKIQNNWRYFNLSKRIQIASIQKMHDCWNMHIDKMKKMEEVFGILFTNLFRKLSKSFFGKMYSQTWSQNYQNIIQCKLINTLRKNIGFITINKIRNFQFKQKKLLNSSHLVGLIMKKDKLNKLLFNQAFNNYRAKVLLGKIIHDLIPIQRFMKFKLNYHRNKLIFKARNLFRLFVKKKLIKDIASAFEIIENKCK